MEDSEIIKLFFERSEKAIEALVRKYGKTLMRISLNILNNRQDSEECMNDMCLSVWNLIPPERPNNLFSYTCRIIRNISIERYKRNTAKKRNSNYDLCIDELNDIIANRSAEDDYDAFILANTIDDFLSSLSEDNQMIFVRRFWYMDSCKAIAKRSGLNEGAVRTRLYRIKSDLRFFLEKRGIQL